MKYHIIGSGISGLALGYFLKNTGKDFRIYEEKSCPGGLIATSFMPEGFIQHGPHLMRHTDAISSLFNNLGVDFAVSATNKKFIAKATDNSIQKLDIGIPEILNAAKYLLRNRKSEYTSLHDFACHHYGEFVAENILQAIANGIYGTDIKNLDYEIALQKFYFSEKKAIYRIAKNLHNIKPSQLIAPLNGFQDFIDKLAADMAGNITYNTKITDVRELSGKVYITVPAFLALQLQGLPSGASQLLQGISYSNLDVTTVFTHARIKFRGIGVLTNSHTGILGILCNSDSFPGRANPGLHSYSVFSKNMAEQDISTFFREAFGINPAKVYFNSYKNCIPIYDSSVKNFIKYNKALSGDVKFFANYTGQVAIGDIIAQAKKSAADS